MGKFRFDLVESDIPVFGIDPSLKLHLDYYQELFSKYTYESMKPMEESKFIDEITQYLLNFQGKVVNRIKKKNFTEVYEEDNLRKCVESIDALIPNIGKLDEGLFWAITFSVYHSFSAGNNFDKKISDRFQANIKMIEKIRRVYWTHPDYKIVVIAGAGHVADYVHDKCLCGIKTGLAGLPAQIGTILLSDIPAERLIYDRFHLNSSYCNQNFDLWSLQKFVQMPYDYYPFSKK